MRGTVSRFSSSRIQCLAPLHCKCTEVSTKHLFEANSAVKFELAAAVRSWQGLCTKCYPCCRQSLFASLRLFASPLPNCGARCCLVVTMDHFECLML